MNQNQAPTTNSSSHTSDPTISSQSDHQQKTDDQNKQQNYQSHGIGEGKEVEPTISLEVPSKNAQEAKEIEKLPEEVEGWMEKVERGEDVHLAKPVSHQGQTLVEPVQPKDIKIILPLTNSDVQKGLHMKVFDSVRWLAVWCIRIIKKFPRKVLYKKA